MEQINSSGKVIMLLFLLGLAILIVGYCTYGKFIENILGAGRPPHSGENPR